MLQHGQLIPGVERNNGLQHGRQIFDLAQHAAPFLQPGIFVPVEIIDERISLADLSAPGPLGLLDRGLGPGEQRVDGGVVGTRKGIDVVDIFPSSSGYFAAAAG